MGTNVSSQLVESTTKIVNEAMTNIANDSSNITKSSAMGYQTATVNAQGAQLVRCPITITQDANVTSQAFADSRTNYQTDLTNTLATKLQEQIDQKLSQVNKELNIGQTNVADITTRSKAYIENNLATIIKSSISNVVDVSAGSTQTATINLQGVRCVDSPQGIRQEALIAVMAQNISQSAVTNIIKNSVSTDIQKKIEQSVAQTNSGINPFALVGIILLVLVLIGSAVFFVPKMLKKKSSATASTIPPPPPIATAGTNPSK